MYLDGKTQEDIIKLCKADTQQINDRSKKSDTKNKIVHFFKVIEGTKKAYIEYPRARVNRTELLSCVYRKTLVSTTSVMRILEALEEQGWSLQEVTKNIEFHDRAPYRRS